MLDFPNNTAIGLPLLGSVVGPEGSTSVSVALAAGSVFLVPLKVERHHVNRTIVPS